MGTHTNKDLNFISNLISEGVNSKNLFLILKTIGVSGYSKKLLKETVLYSEFLPMAIEQPFTPHQRYLHFLWEVFDKTPLSLCVSFAVPFRRLIAENLFKKCGKNFIAEAHCIFNLGQNLEIGNDVFLNRDVYLDAKGGIEIGDCVALTENVKIFTHTHSEDDHSVREYQKVVIKDFAKIYTGSTILPGVTIGKQALVAAGSLVTKDVPDNCLVAGTPAKIIRERATKGKSAEELNHIWLGNAAFQKS